MSRIDLRVARSAIRCPYCHGELVVAAPDWVACRECMARHHGECWDERARCASCGSAERLVSAPARVERALSELLDAERSRIKAALHALEAAWDMERRRILGLPASAPWVEPVPEGGGVVIFGGIGAGLLLFGAAAGAVSFVVLCAVATVSCFAAAVTATLRQETYATARSRYVARREELRRELDGVGAGA